MSTFSRVPMSKEHVQLFVQFERALKQAMADLKVVRDAKLYDFDRVQLAQDAIRGISHQIFELHEELIFKRRSNDSVASPRKQIESRPVLALLSPGGRR